MTTDKKIPPTLQEYDDLVLDKKTHVLVYYQGSLADIVYRKQHQDRDGNNNGLVIVLHDPFREKVIEVSHADECMLLTNFSIQPIEHDELPFTVDDYERLVLERKTFRVECENGYPVTLYRTNLKGGGYSVLGVYLEEDCECGVVWRSNGYRVNPGYSLVLRRNKP